MSQVVSSPKEYDVCIIGSGAGGGTAAKVLTEGGLNVVMLEAGPPLNPKDFKEHVWPYQLPHRGDRTSARHEPNRIHGAQWLSGKSRASPTPLRPAQAFDGFARGLKAAAPIIGDASLCASVPQTSRRTPPTAWATTGRSPMKNSRLTTTRLSRTSASSDRKKMSRTRRTAFFFRRPGRAALRPSSRRPAIG